MSPPTSTTASCARPCATPPTVESALAEVVAHAATLGVGLDAYLDGPEIWVQEITRDAGAAPGAGRDSLRRLQALATERSLTIGLAFWACNSALRAYYTALGFVVVEEPDDPEDDDDAGDEDDHAIARWQPPRLPHPRHRSPETRHDP